MVRILEAALSFVSLLEACYMITGSEVHIDIFDDRMEIYSPGGMMDGLLVQDLNTDTVPSKRRNPVIADVFSRMNYMERRGRLPPGGQFPRGVGAAVLLGSHEFYRDAFQSELRRSR